MRWTLCGVCAALAVAGAPAVAAEADPAGVKQGAARRDADWEVVVTPYAWLTAATGEVSARGTTVDFDASIVDVISNTNIAAFGALQVRRNRVVLLLDGMFAELEDDFEVGSRTVGAGPLRFDRTVPAFADLIQRQDILACQGVQAGLASRLAEPGRYSHLEKALWQLQRFLLERAPAA